MRRRSKHLVAGVLVALVGTLGAVGQVTPQAPARATIQGVVLDALGAPIPACRVDLRSWAVESETLATTRTDGHGFFVFSRPLETRSYQVRVVSPGRVTVEDGVRVTSSRSTRHVSLRAWDAGAIRGRVVDAGGDPVAGAAVIAAYDSARVFGFDPQASAVSDAEGRFELPGVALGWNQVRAWKDGFALAEESTWLRDEAELTLKLRPDAGVRMELQVAGLPDGVTAHVSVLPYANGSHQVLPDGLRRGEVATGSPWIRTGLPPFQFRVRLHASGYVFAPDHVMFQPGQVAYRTVFRATPASEDADAGQAPSSARIRGVLRDQQGRPLAGERLVLRQGAGGRRSEAVTDAEGRFDCVAPRAAGTDCVAYLVGSDHVLTQTGHDPQAGPDSRFRGWHHFVIGADEQVELRAAPAAVVSGRLVDVDGGPVRWTRVELQVAKGNRTPAHWVRFASAETDRDGRFRFVSLNPPPQMALRVAAGHAETGASTSETFTLGHGEERTGLSIELAPHSAVIGYIRDAEGEPIPGARVWLRTDAAVQEVLTDRAGRFALPDVEPGLHEIEVLLEGRRPVFTSETFDARPGETIELPVRLAGR